MNANETKRMSPWFLRADLAKALKLVCFEKDIKLTRALNEAVHLWLEQQGVIDDKKVDLEKQRQAKEAAAREQAVRDAEKRLIDHLEHWRRHGGGKPYPFLAGRTCPPGFEDVIRGTLGKEEEI